MDKQDMIYDRLKEISKDVKDIKEDVNRNTSDLEYHIKRTNMLEERAILVNWKTVGIFFSILGSIFGIAVAITRLM